MPSVPSMPRLDRLQLCWLQQRKVLSKRDAVYVTVCNVSVFHHRYVDKLHHLEWKMQVVASSLTTPPRRRPALPVSTCFRRSHHLGREDSRWLRLFKICMYRSIFSVPVSDLEASWTGMFAELGCWIQLFGSLLVVNKGIFKWLPKSKHCINCFHLLIVDLDSDAIEQCVVWVALEWLMVPTNTLLWEKIRFLSLLQIIKQLLKKRERSWANAWILSLYTVHTKLWWMCFERRLICRCRQLKSWCFVAVTFSLAKGAIMSVCYTMGGGMKIVYQRCFFKEAAIPNLQHTRCINNQRLGQRSQDFGLNS